MRLKVFSVRDSKAGCFNVPFFQKSHGEAERSFSMLLQDDKSMISKYPDDFDLYYVGDFDDQDGVFNALETPQHVVKAVALRTAISERMSEQRPQ